MAINTTSPHPEGWEEEQHSPGNKKHRLREPSSFVYFRLYIQGRMTDRIKAIVSELKLNNVWLSAATSWREISKGLF